MKLKFAAPLFAISVASSAALAASGWQSTPPAGSQAQAQAQAQQVQMAGQGGTMNKGPMMRSQSRKAALPVNMSYARGGNMVSGLMPNTLASRFPDRTAIGNNWFDRISINGLLNADAFYQSNKNVLAPLAAGTNNNVNYSGLALDGYLNVDGQVNSAWDVFTSIQFATSPQPQGINGVFDAGGVFAPTRYYPTEFSSTARQGDPIVNEMYVQYYTPNSPFQVRGGRQYVAFNVGNGMNDINNAMPYLTDQLTKTRATALQVGYYGQNAAGLNGAVFAFNGQKSATTSDDNNITGFGGTVGIHNANRNQRVGYDVNVSLLNNIQNAGAFQGANAVGTGTSSTAANPGGYGRTVPAVAVNAKVKARQFDVFGDLTAATRSFSTSDYTFNGGNAQPVAGLIGAGMKFNLYKPSRFELNYQWSNNALDLNGGTAATAATGAYVSLPKHRIEGRYMVNILPRADFGLVIDYDKAYKTNQGGTGKDNVTGLARLSVALG